MLLKELSENIRTGMTMGEAMERVGYSKKYSLNPNHLKETESWKKLIEQELGDELLVDVHKGLLKHKEWRARDAGLDKAYKLKKKYGDITISHKFNELSDEDLEGAIAREVSETLGAIAGKKTQKRKQ